VELELEQLVGARESSSVKGREWSKEIHIPRGGMFVKLSTLFPYALLRAPLAAKQVGVGVNVRVCVSF
jgi:hypothetical protein